MNLRCISTTKDVTANQMYLQCDRCLRASITCQPDPMHLCKRCHYNKQGCSLMPVNKKTGKTDQWLRYSTSVSVSSRGRSSKLLDTRSQRN